MIIKSNKSYTPAPTKSSIEEFANALIERCTHLIDLLNTTNTANTTATTADADAATIPNDMDFSHVRELELLSNQTMTLIDACDESLCLQDARQQIQQEDLYVSIKTMKSFVSLVSCWYNTVILILHVVFNLAGRNPNYLREMFDTV